MKSDSSMQKVTVLREIAREGDHHPAWDFSNGTYFKATTTVPRIIQQLYVSFGNEYVVQRYDTDTPRVLFQEVVNEMKARLILQMSPEEVLVWMEANSSNS